MLDASTNLRAGGLAVQDRPIMHHGRDLLVEQMNCGGLGNEVCEGDTCNDDLVPVNMGGLKTICRKPEEAQGQETASTAEDLSLIHI